MIKDTAKDMKKVIANLKPSALIGFALFPLIIIINETVGDLPTWKLAIYSVTIFLSCTVVALVALIILKDIMTLTEKATSLSEKAIHLNQVVKQSYQQRHILVSNEMLQEIETNSNLIRIVSPDLYDDEHSFYSTILENVKNKKTYEYIIPERPELEGKIEKLIKHLKKDANLKNGYEPLKYKTISESMFPIITAYGVYHKSNDIEIVGVVEVKIGPNENDVSHLYLSNHESHRLNKLFDRLFTQS